MINSFEIAFIAVYIKGLTYKCLFYIDPYLQKKEVQ